MLERGTNVAGYRVDGVLGEGGMGVVYRATQLSLNRVVALKVLAAELSDDPDFRTRFQREGQLQAALDHEHIVSVYEAGQTEHGLFLAMRLIPGPTLKDLILEGQLDARRSLRLLAQVARALDEAHAAGLIHRDIKPQNILIGRDDHAYLADFGLTKAPDDSTRLTGTGQFIGTIDYVAPEQIQGEPASAASDCYSLAAVLYECLTREVPFPRHDETATIYAHLTAPPPRVTDRRPDLPVELDAVVAAGMAKDPSARPPSARDLISAATRASATGSASASAAPVTAPGQETRMSGGPLADPGQVTRAGGVATAPSPAPVVPAATSPSPAAATAASPGAPAAVTAASAASPAAATAASAAPLAAATAASAASPAAATAAAAPPAAGLTAAPREATAPEGARGSRAVAAVFVLAAVAAIVVGLLIGRSGKSTSSPSLANSATNGHLQLRYPAGWTLGAPAGLPGVSFTGPIVLTPKAGGAQLAAGEVATIGPTLLPATFRARVQGALPPGQPVSLGGLEAYRYPGLHVSGLSAPVTVYAAPTSAGVAIIGCWPAGASGSAFATQCAQVATTLRLLAATAYPLGPDPAYAHALGATFAGLRTNTTAPLSQLHSAGTPSAQAAAATRLASAYSAAAGELAPVAVSPQAQGANAAIVAALRSIATGYSRAAAAADSGSTAAYTAAEQQIGAGSTALSNALARLSALGYSVG